MFSIDMIESIMTDNIIYKPHMQSLLGENTPRQEKAYQGRGKHTKAGERKIRE
jgi:hypothetical protein